MPQARNPELRPSPPSSSAINTGHVVWPPVRVATGQRFERVPGSANALGARLHRVVKAADRQHRGFQLARARRRPNRVALGRVHRLHASRHRRFSGNTRSLGRALFTTTLSRSRAQRFFTASCAVAAREQGSRQLGQAGEAVLADDLHFPGLFAQLSPSVDRRDPSTRSRMTSSGSPSTSSTLPRAARTVRSSERAPYKPAKARDRRTRHARHRPRSASSAGLGPTGPCPANSEHHDARPARCRPTLAGRIKARRGRPGALCQVKIQRTRETGRIQQQAATSRRPRSSVCSRSGPSTRRMAAPRASSKPDSTVR